MGTDDSLAEFLNQRFGQSSEVHSSHVKQLLTDKGARHADLIAQLNATQATTHETLANLFYSDTNEHISTDDASLVPKLADLETQYAALQTAVACTKGLVEAHNLDEKSRVGVATDIRGAIECYNQLIQLVSTTQDTVQDQLPEAMDRLKAYPARLYQHLFDIFAKDFRETLDALSWPTPLKPPYGFALTEIIQRFSKSLRHLLLLKSPRKNDDTQLAPITIMVEALSLRFRFHFESNKPTNRLDKPEWYLAHVRNTIGHHMAFLVVTVQPIVSDTLGDVSAKDAFIAGILENIWRKFQHTVPKILHDRGCLSHTIHEALLFDNSLIEDFDYHGMRVSDWILQTPTWFQTWYQAEKDFAQERYDEIITDLAAFEPHEESRSDNANKVQPTNSAVRVTNLIMNVTETYKLLPNVEQRLRFFITIQLGLLAQYHKRINTALDSFESLTMMRAVPVPGGLPDAVTGVVSSAETGGSLAAMRRLSRWWSSGRTIQDVTREMADEDFFLDMQYNVQENSSTVQSILADTTDKLPQLETFSDNTNFLSVASDCFQHLCQRTQKLLVRMMVKEWAQNARPYTRKWQLPPSDVASLDDLSTELYQPLQTFQISCGHVASTLPEADFSSLLQGVYLELEEWHLRNIIAPNRLDRDALDQLERDLELGLWKMGRRWVMKPENYMKKLKRAIAKGAS
ncbi:TIP-1 family-domain-containing protein [Syncephalastrum racemosum]|uniref:TIP-1 family-domain-containing protein n=1 Tax=Syncephalastrum racemosum TaxID=13706 RepID=A0A1X2H0I8_SYNRA|nr:TIP-1 family-domain-containing protein [Syncephalastrum racemosum]